ncbi:site-specific integrase [Aminipila luticellarii]|uniref:Site-specific integrase n=1 Tax=Aminipila luticellarii TaxID=2507160 RepID=A0A410PW23_9FIRM|nr:site-specific integrase [Aminipila luticellarii]QAT43115.1 site-specific integrase [Aminipila luticellarii]
MARRGENVYKRKDGRWEGRILKSDGKYHSIYAKTYKEIKEKKNNYQEKGVYQEEVNHSSKNSAELFEVWLETEIAGRVKPSTYGSYYFVMQNYVIPFFNRNGHERITELSASQFVKSIKDNLSLAESYKRKIISVFKLALKEILKDSKEYSLIERNIKLPKSECDAVQVFSIMEQRKIESTILDWEDQRAMGILLCFYTGIRLGELCGLRWGDMDLEAGTMVIMRTVSRIKNFQPGGKKTMLFIGRPKSQKSIRKIPLPDFLLKLIAPFKMQSLNEEDYVFSGTDIPMDPRTYQKMYKRILSKAGVQDRKFHAIRHTFATRALELGIDIKTLSEILGHSNVSITLNIYAHSLMEQKKLAIDRFNVMHMKHMHSPSITPSGRYETQSFK